MKKGRLFYKIFFPVSILGIIFVAGFSSYVYTTTEESVYIRMADGKQDLINQIRNTLEQKIQTIEYAFDTYSTTGSFQETVNNPITIEDFEAYREVNTQLNYIATMAMDGAQYSLISLTQNWMVSSNGRLTSLSESDRQELIDQYVRDRNKGIFWVKTPSGIRYVHLLPVFSKNKQAIATADIPLQALESSVQADDQTVLYILDKTGQVLYQSKAEEGKLDAAALQQVAQLSGDMKPHGTAKLESGSSPGLQAIYARSSYNNWVYVTVLNQREISDALQTTLLGLISMALALTLLIIAVAYFIALLFTKPIRQIQRSLPDRPGADNRNEIDWIIRSIASIRSEKENMEVLLKAELPQLETQFILNLFRGRVSAEELEQNMRRFGYETAGELQYVCMLIQLDNYGTRQAMDRDLLLLAVNRLVEELIPATKRMLPILLNEKTQATILMFKNPSGQELHKSIFEYAKSIILNARECLNLSVSIGISSVYGNLLNSKEACDMSKQALHHRLNLGKESIIFYEDISMVVSGSATVRYPVELESRLFEAIRLGDESQISGALYPLLAELMKLSKNSANLENALIRLVSNLIQLEQLIGVEVLQTGGGDSLYHRLLDNRNPEEIERILVHEVIYPMVSGVKEKTNRQFRSLSGQVAAIVQAEYDQDLSLESIGDRLHYNSNYLSSIFKKEYGVTFSEYLMLHRLEVAKKWLSETDMTIKEIAERLQYNNPQNFIRSFRKKEYVTPGAYRKMRQAN